MMIKCERYEYSFFVFRGGGGILSQEFFGRGEKLCITMWFDQVRGEGLKGRGLVGLENQVEMCCGNETIRANGRKKH